MGCCLSKKDPCSQSVPSVSQIHQIDSKKGQTLDAPVRVEQTKKQIAAIEANPKEENETEEREEERKEVLPKKKKEVFVIQHRKSNDKRPGAPDSEGSTNSGDPNRESEEVGRNILAAAASGQVVRTSSCTKEEVDAILIQCGRLSRSSSGIGNGNGKGNGGHGRRYSGSKRSFDFDKENDVDDSKGKGNGNDDLIEANYEDDERSRRRQSRGSHRRKTTPSRSREREQQQQRSGSRERSQSNGRRVSRSPGRRSESPMTHSNSNSSGNGRPGKLVSVPATVTSLTMERANNGNGNGSGRDGNVKRVLVKRNVGSPRSQSPARAHSPAKAGNQANGNGIGCGGGQQPASLSRNGSRKAEQSPYRRTPLNEIDINALPFHPLSNKRAVHKGKEIEEDIVVVRQPVTSVSQNKYAESNNSKASAQGNHRRSRSRGAEGYEVTKTNYCRVNELQTMNVEQMTDYKREQIESNEYKAMVSPVVMAGAETLKLPQTLMRSRSARQSRDLDINVEALLAPNLATNYTSLLLQDIQNFHQKKSSTNAISPNNDSSAPPFALPACVSKACSILEAVADLNSTTRETNFSVHKRVDSKDPFVVTEIKVGDDLMEPSLHKYVTVRKRGGDMDDEESSGSNSFVGGSMQQNWASSSTWEPTSAESTDCWTSNSYSREELSPVGFQRHAISDIACVTNDESQRIISKGAARARTTATSKAVASSM